MTRPKLRDVAKLAGVSEMTVSRVMRKSMDVSEHTKFRVEEAAKELGYVPDQIAGSMASKAVNLVGVIIPSHTSHIYPEVLSGIASVFDPVNVKVFVGVTKYDLEQEEQLIREMLGWRPRGLIISGLEHTDASRKMLKQSGIPIVEIMDTDGGVIDFNVGISQTDVGVDMANKLVEKKYKNIGFIGTRMECDFRAQKRYQGFVNGLAEHGLSIMDSTHYDGISSISQGRELTEKLLNKSPKIDCIYYSTDIMAIGGLMHAIVNGISVPDQLALAGFNALDLLDGLAKSIATTDAKRFEIGKIAAEYILDTSSQTTKQLKLDATIQMGDTI